MRSARTPLAFGSTYADESKRSDAEWRARAARFDGRRAIGYLAWDHDQPCGLAGGFLNADDPARAELVSMWVAPTHRRQGVGRLLVGAISDWALTRNVRKLCLMVTSTNHAAIRFYERLGFVPTGRTEPYPNDPALVELEMSRALG